MKETVKTIMEWQEQTFPDATLEGQNKKFAEEQQEFFASFHRPEGKDIFELADMFIVACGISRFDILEGQLRMFGTISTAVDFGVDLKDLFNAVQKKMEINRARDWNYKDGQYKHKGKECDTIQQ